MSVQLPAHAVVPAGQLAMHVDAPQTSPAAQTVVHIPQWVGSLVISTQTPPQSVSPPGHAHIPARHSIPPEQTTPQAPQLVSSLSRLTQVPPQSVRPPRQPVIDTSQTAS